MLEDPPRSIEGIEYDEHDSCYRISPFDLPTFLGHQESEYGVEDLFSGIKTSWFITSNPALRSRKIVADNFPPSAALSHVSTSCWRAVVVEWF